MAPPLPVGCPWSGFAPPTLQFCEENLCAWITTPANTWSNLVYFLVAAWLSRSVRPKDAKALRLFAPVAVFVGGGSFLYHASYTLALQLLDNLAMYAFACLLLVLNLLRLGVCGPGSLPAAYLATAGGAAAAMGIALSAGFPIQAVFGALVALVLGSEAALASGGARPSYRWLAVSTGIFVASFALWLLDAFRIVCDPGNHFLQGHAAWHVGTALCFLSLRNFYRQFDLDGAGRSG